MLQNSLKKAKKAKKKEANFGEDIDIEEFKIEEPDEHESVESLEEIPKKYQNTLLQVGVDPKSEERGGSFMMMDQSGIMAQSHTESIEILNIKDALEKYDWLSDYMWNAIAVDTDKYTAETALGDPGGFFIRAKPGAKTVFPIQACMFIGDERLAQKAHNIVIAEEGSEIHMITGCATGTDVSSALHIGVSEFYIKKDAKISYTMVHNWG